MCCDINSPWLHLTDHLLNGTNITSYQEKYKQQPILERFATLMEGLTLPVLHKLPQLDIWEKYESFTDIGGSKGHLAARICEQNKNIKGIVADLSEMNGEFEKFVS